MRYDTVIFDFDGTLCDTGEGIQKSAAFALDAFHIPHEAWDKLGFFMGPPLLITFQEKYGVSPTEAEALVAKFRERYSETGIFESRLFDGVYKMLKSLKAHGAKVGIASSKPQTYIEQLLERFEILPFVDKVCGVTFQADCEPKAEIVARCAQALGVQEDAKENVLMVGDTKLDADGANANGFDMCGVSYGYGSRFEILEQIWIDGKLLIDNGSEVKRFSDNDKSVALSEGLHSIKALFLGNSYGGWPTNWGDGSIKIRKSDEESFKKIMPESLFH